MIEKLKAAIKWIFLGWAIIATAGVIFLAIRSQITWVKNEYITTNSTANSYANSGSVAIGYIGAVNGEWEIITLVAYNQAEFDAMIRSLSPAEFAFAKILRVSDKELRIYYPEIGDKKTVKTGEKKSEYIERKGVK